MESGEVRFRRSFIGYNRASVDREFEKLLNQVDDALDKNDELRNEIRELKDERRELESSKRALEDERTAMSRERASLADSVTSITGRVSELQNSLVAAQAANEALQNKIDASVSEKNEMQMRLDTVQERNHELTMRERQFNEIEKSVSSIMSVTKRATDRLFQKSVENQENVIRIAGDAAQEAAKIRADLSSARDDMNVAFDELQDRIDKIDASLTGAVHKLVAIKHDSGLKNNIGNTTIESEVERLLSLRAGEVDYSDGKGYAVPVLGPYSSKFISDTAQKVSSGETDIHPVGEHYEQHKPLSGDDEDSHPNVGVRKSFPSMFESSDASIREANKLLDAADAISENNASTKYTAPETKPVPPQQNAPTYVPYQTQPYVPPQKNNPIGFGHRYDMVEEEVNPYSGETFEKVDIASLNADSQTVTSQTQETQYDLPIVQPQTIEPQDIGVYDSPAMNVNMSQDFANASATPAYEFAGRQPSFIPNNIPVVSVDAVSEAAPSEPEAKTDVPSNPKGKHVAVNKRYGRNTGKVKIFVRHGK